jgi:hypothetical protein
MIRRTVFKGVLATAILVVICVAVVVAQGEGNGNSKVAVLAGWELVESADFTLEPNSSAELTAECPGGKVPLGGGFSKHPSTPDSESGFEVAASFPAHFTFEGNLFSGWIVHVVNRGTANVFVTTWATCGAMTEKTFR